jgi:Lon protease-like protein
MDPFVELPEVIAVFPLRGTILLPGSLLPLNIFEPRYLNMFDDVLSSHRMIGMVQSIGGDPVRPGLEQVGCLGRISSFTQTDDGRYLVSLSGVCRFRIDEELNVSSPYRQVRADYLPFLDDLDEVPVVPVDVLEQLYDAMATYVDLAQGEVDWTSVRAVPAGILLSSLCMSLPVSPIEKQCLLEAPDLEERLRLFQSLVSQLSKTDLFNGPEGQTRS